jgi:hypothetical protein
VDVGLDAVAMSLAEGVTYSGAGLTSLVEVALERAAVPEGCGGWGRSLRSSGPGGTLRPMDVAPCIAVTLALLACACGSAQRSAARDPMRCERDPACAKARGSYVDCSRQCVDNPECVARCDEVQAGTSLGHP